MAVPVNAIIQSYDPNLSIGDASTPPSSWYTEPAILDLERRAVFPHSWQFAARTEQLTESGRYVTCDIAGEPVLIVRGRDNTLRAFFNVCRHHAAAILTQAEGTVENLRCPYHGWTYDLEGNLILTPDFGGVTNFDRGAYGLAPMQLAVWNNWLFANPQAGNPSLEDFLGKDLLKRFGRLNFERFHWFERRSYSLNCNWKVFVDNYLDGGYHVPHIHGGLNSVLDYSNYTIETGERFCLQSSSMAPGQGDPKTAAARTGKRAYYYWIYPNFMINVYDDVMDTNLVVPRGVAKTEVIFDYYFADVSQQAREKNLASISVSEQIQSEDVAICESVQRGLNSRAYTTGRLSVRREAGEHLFHKLLHGDLKRGIEI